MSERTHQSDAFFLYPECIRFLKRGRITVYVKLTWELLGAVIGAGLASGREVAAYFSCYGAWGYAGVFVFLCVMVILGDACDCELAPNLQWLDNIWQVIMKVMLITTGGSMLAAVGHIGSLTLPVRNASNLSVCIALVVAYLLAVRIKQGLSIISRLLIVCMVFVIICGWCIPPAKAVRVEAADPLAALMRAIAYGGFSAALQAPILHAESMQGKHTSSARVSTAGILTLIILACHITLMRHPGLIGEAMPMVMMASRFGRTGYWFCVVSMYAAILSTLTACIRSSSGSMLSITLMILVSIIGFEEAVGIFYNVIGTACAVVLVLRKICKFRIYWRTHF